MALIKCKECGQEISDMATACPKCGKPQENIELYKSIISFMKTLGYCLLTVSGVILVWLIISGEGIGLIADIKPWMDFIGSIALIVIMSSGGIGLLVGSKVFKETLKTLNK